MGGLSVCDPVFYFSRIAYSSIRKCFIVPTVDPSGFYHSQYMKSTAVIRLLRTEARTNGCIASPLLMLLPSTPARGVSNFHVLAQHALHLNVLLLCVQTSVR
jgi:hypothetical protein